MSKSLFYKEDSYLNVPVLSVIEETHFASYSGAEGHINSLFSLETKSFSAGYQQNDGIGLDVTTGRLTGNNIEYTTKEFEIPGGYNPNTSTLYLSSIVESQNQLGWKARRELNYQPPTTKDIGTLYDLVTSLIDAVTANGIALTLSDNDKAVLDHRKLIKQHIPKS